MNEIPTTETETPAWLDPRPDQPCVVWFRDVYGRPDRDVYVLDLEAARRVAGADAAQFGDAIPRGDRDGDRRPRSVIWPVAWSVASTVTTRPIAPGYPQVLERGHVIELTRSRNGDMRTIIADADEHGEVCSVANHLDDNTAAALIDFGRRQYAAGRLAGQRAVQRALRDLIDAPSTEALEALTRR